MECMTELVQEGLDLVISQQSRLVSRCAGEVHHIHDVRTMVFLALAILRLEVVHPCAATLAVTRVEVAIVHGKELALLVKHLISRHFGVIDMDILVLLEGQTIEALGEPEHALFHVLKFKIGAQYIVGDSVFLLFELFGIVTPVPRLQGGIEPVCSSKLLQFSHFLHSNGHIVLTQLVEERHHGLLIVGAGLVERLLGVVAFSEEFGQLKTGVDDVDDDLGVVELAPYAAAVVGGVEFTAEVAVSAVLHHGDVGGGLEVEQPTLFACLLGVGTKHSLGVVVDAGKVFLTGNEHRPCVGGFEHVLTVGEGEFAQACRQLAIRLFVFGTEVGTVVGKGLVDVFQQFCLLLVEVKRTALVVHRLDALEQFLVQANGSRILRHLGREFHLNLLELLVGLCVGEVVEAACHDREELPRLLVRLDGVLESRCRRVVGNSVNLCESLFHSLLEGGHVVLRTNLVEGIRLVRGLPVLVVEERIGLSHRRDGYCNSSHSN